MLQCCDCCLKNARETFKISQPNQSLIHAAEAYKLPAIALNRGQKSSAHALEGLALSVWHSYMQAIARLRLLKGLVKAEILPAAAIHTVEAAALRTVYGNGAKWQTLRQVSLAVHLATRCGLSPTCFGALQSQRSTLRGLVPCPCCRPARLASHSSSKSGSVCCATLS